MKQIDDLAFLKNIAPKHRKYFAKCDEVVSIVQPFADGTHQLRRCRFGREWYFLKVCDPKVVQNSPFWQAMESVFKLQLAKNLKYYEYVYQQIQNISMIKTPVLKHVESSSANFSGFLLTNIVRGEAIQAGAVSSLLVGKLAEHLSILHQNTSQFFGPFYRLKELPFKGLKAQAWFTHLTENLVRLSVNSEVNQRRLAQALADLRGQVQDVFVPIMLDLRWDQFLYEQKSNRITLVDLDAIVWGPKALEFVLLEYLLTQEQLVLFSAVYTQNNQLPLLNKVRNSYRILLFLMTVLGEQDFDRWMAQPSYFMG